MLPTTWSDVITTCSEYVLGNIYIVGDTNHIVGDTNHIVGYITMSWVSIPYRGGHIDHVMGIMYMSWGHVDHVVGTGTVPYHVVGTHGSCRGSQT